MNMKTEITKVTLDCMLGIREGVGECRVKEFAAYIKTLIEAKNAGLETDTILFPMLTDRAKQGIEAALSAKSGGGVDGGIKWEFINLSGGYHTEKRQGIRVKVDMEFLSAGAPDLIALQAMSVQDLEKLLLVVDKPQS